MSDPLIGKTLGGCELLDTIGQGGMGVIYRARQKSLDRVVAIKVLSPRLSSDEAFVSRFQREARAIAKVNHPNILAVYDVAEENGVHYFIMELIDGCSLAELQTQRRVLPAEEAAEYIRQAAMGLSAAQQVGIIHRDIKPENLMCTRSKIIKVSDFGLAKEADSSHTSTEAVMGTPAFMSPEQCDGKRVDGRSDIYSLGGTFYKLITGRFPFEAETAMSMMYRHKHEPLVPPVEIVPSVPTDMSDLIVRMMAKKREHRPQTMDEVVQALDMCLRPMGVSGEDGPDAFDTAYPAVPRPEIRAGTARFVHRPPSSASAHVPGQTAGGPKAAPAKPPNRTSARFESPPASGVANHRPPTAHMDPLPMSGRFGPPPARGDSIASGMVGETRVPAMNQFPPGTPVDEIQAQIAKGEELLGRGDKIGGLKCFRIALGYPGLDEATRTQLENVITEEVDVRRRTAMGLVQRGMLVEAGREFRILIDLDPRDEEAKSQLKLIDQKLQTKRTIVNDIRTFIGGGQYQQAVEAYDKMPPELREDALTSQIERLRSVVIPTEKLCNEADKLNNAGKLEEAKELFDQALALDESCERARQGSLEIERKFSSIDRLLREGYDLAQKHEYAKAIEVWTPILGIRTGHTQARKFIVDARVNYAQILRRYGDLAGAIAQLKAATSVDPFDRKLAASVEDLRTLFDTETALTERANEAVRKGRYGKALVHWRRVLEINPANKKAVSNVALLGRMRTMYWAKTLSALVLLSVCGSCGYIYFTERRRIEQAKEAVDGGRYSEAMAILAPPALFLREEAKRLLLRAELMSLMGQAEADLAEKRYAEAAKAFERGEELADDDRDAKRRFSIGAINAKVMVMKRSATVLEESGEWKRAYEAYSAAADLLDSPVARGELGELQEEIRLACKFASLVEQGEGFLKLQNKVRALECFREAAKMRKDHPLVKERLDVLDKEASAFAESIGEARKLLESGNDVAAINAAESKLDEALARAPGDAVAALLRQYARDLKACAGEGMALVSGANPLKSSMWGLEDRKRAFCIDRYEHPNKAGEMPMTDVSWLEAKRFCADQNKILCTKQDWSDGCKGEGFNRPYPYGLAFQADVCNTAGGKAEPSGGRARCVNSFGLFDMSGNVAEWVDESKSGEDAEVMGGFHSVGAEDARCDSARRLALKQKHAEVGFRCCKRLVK